MTTPLCDLCHARPSTCRGAYDGAALPSFACDACCGHSNESGWCELLPAPATRLDKRGQAATTAIQPPCCDHQDSDPHRPGYCPCCWNCRAGESGVITDDPASWPPEYTIKLAAAALGRLGGQSRSEAKRAASRANGKLGGYRRHKARRAD